MGRIAEAMLDELEGIARRTGEQEEDVHREWWSEWAKEKTFTEFAVAKSQKRAKK